jgi:hypothetical protein
MEATEIKNAPVPPTGAPAENENVQPIQIPEHLNQQQALQILVDAARVSQSKGIFSLDDAELVNKAIKAFMPPQGPVPTNP